LTEIRDPAAAERLVVALGDKDPDVRWVVAEALIALRRPAMKPLLKALTRSDGPEGLYEGAHHVLHALAKHRDLAGALTPVIAALDQPEPELAVPLAAEKVVRDLAD
jgi:HEAT repeat protein